MKRIIRGIVLILVLSGMVYIINLYIYHPNSYRDKKAISNGDVVMAADGLHNMDGFYNLLEAIDGKEPFGSIRITCYSKEGYPIIFDINYDGETIYCITDNTRNLFGRDKKKEYGDYTSYEVRGNNDYFLLDSSGTYEDRWIIQLR